MMEWHDIKDGLPPIGTALIVTIFDSIHNRWELRYPVEYRKSYYSDHYGFYQYGLEENMLLKEYSEVFAWMEIPEPYRTVRV